MDYDRLLDFCTTLKQRELVRAVDACHGNVANACRMLGWEGAGTVYRRMFRQVKERAAKAGVTDGPITRDVAPGFTISKISTLSKEGEGAKLEWVQQKPEAVAQHEAMLAAVEELSRDIPRLKPVAGPKESLPDLVNLYTLTDCHVGALAWHKEGGADWDLSIAESILIDSFAAMIAGAPDAETAIVSQLGDYLHFDGLVAQTPMNKHPLDADGRFGKIVEVAIRILRRVIDMSLAKHAKVHVVMAEGNHDMVSSIWLRKMFKALYENEPRVTVDDSELPYYVYQHGETMLAFHHGHLKRNDSFPLFFATQFPIIWGSTTKRYGHCGHRHHVEEKEHSGMTVVQHTTLAARDAYAARGGWHSERAATAITYHKKFGKVATNTVSPEMLEAA